MRIHLIRNLVLLVQKMPAPHLFRGEVVQGAPSSYSRIDINVFDGSATNVSTHSVPRGPTPSRLVDDCPVVPRQSGVFDPNGVVADKSAQGAQKGPSLSIEGDCGPFGQRILLRILRLGSAVNGSRRTGVGSYHGTFICRRARI